MIFRGALLGVKASEIPASTWIFVLEVACDAGRMQFLAVGTRSLGHCVDVSSRLSRLIGYASKVAHQVSIWSTEHR